MRKQVYNPFLPLNEYIPDGEPHVYGDRVYVYGSHDRFRGHAFCLNDYVCWSAPLDELGNWRYEGVIFGRGDDPDNRRAMVWGQANPTWQAFYTELIRLKRETLAGCRILRISLRDTLTITLRKPNGAKLYAVVTPVNQAAHADGVLNGKPIFGKADVTEAGVEVHGFALFEDALEE